MAASNEDWRSKIGTVDQGLFHLLPGDKSTYGQHHERRRLEQLYNAFVGLYDRAPTQIEISKLYPYYLQDVSIGNQAVSELFEREQQSPEAKAKKAPEHYGSINELFKNNLGRDATAQEQEHFGKLIATGDADAYTVGQFLQQLPEYTQKADKSFREGLTGELQAGDKRYFEEAILPTVQSTFANQGRDIRSSGFSNALAQAATQQNRQRETFLSNLTAQQYQGNKAAARADYETSLGRLYGGQDYTRGRADQLADRSQQRLFDLQDFSMQKQMYDEYLRRYGKRGGLGGAIGGIVGGGIGAFLGKGSPEGTATGYQVGSGLGGGFGSLFR